MEPFGLLFRTQPRPLDDVTHTPADEPAQAGATGAVAARARQDQPGLARRAQQRQPGRRFEHEAGRLEDDAESLLDAHGVTALGCGTCRL